jgi:hypothetical protein
MRLGENVFVIVWRIASGTHRVNVNFEHHSSIYSKAEENDGKPRYNCPVAGPFRCSRNSKQQPGIPTRES